MTWQDPKCGHPECEKLADIVCTRLDGDERGHGGTMCLCTYHFWDWNARSLLRRMLAEMEAGEDAAAAVYEEAQEAVDAVLPLVTDETETAYQMPRADSLEGETFPRKMF